MNMDISDHRGYTSSYPYAVIVDYSQYFNQNCRDKEDLEMAVRLLKHALMILTGIKRDDIHEGDIRASEITGKITRRGNVLYPEIFRKKEGKQNVRTERA